MSHSRAIALACYVSIVPAAVIALVLGFMFGPISVLSFAILPMACYVNFLYCERTSGKTSWLLKYHWSVILDELRPLQNVLERNFPNPTFTGACYRALWYLNPESGWNLLEPLTRIASRLDLDEQWIFIDEVRLFLEHRPVPEVWTRLPLIVDKLAHAGIALSLSPSPAFTESELEIDDVVTRRTAYQVEPVPHDINVRFEHAPAPISLELRLAEPVVIWSEAAVKKLEKYKYQRDAIVSEIERANLNAQLRGKLPNRKILTDYWVERAAEWLDQEKS